MPIGRLGNGLPVARTRDGLPIGRVRNDLPTVGIRNDLPNVRSDFGVISTLGTDITIQSGTPMGLLLILTYANTFTYSTGATFKGISPTARIRSID